MSFMDRLNEAKTRMPGREEALPGRSQAIAVPDKHYVLASPLVPPFPEQMELVMFGMGCFWGAEKAFWQLPGVFTTAVGYAAGYTPNPSYEEVCTGMTGHNEAVLVVFDPAQISYSQILRVFWEGHNPTQGMRQGNDVGSQYRSGIYVTNDEEAELAQASLQRYQQALNDAGFGEITTEVVKSPEFYYAEHYHQQYLAKNPNGYCGLGGAEVAFPAET